MFFDLTSNKIRLFLAFSKPHGKSPLKLLFGKSITCGSVEWQIDEGIGPVNLLFEAKNLSVPIDGRGSDPFRILLDMLMYHHPFPEKFDGIHVKEL